VKMPHLVRATNHWEFHIHVYNFIPLLKGDIIIKLQQLLILVHWKSGKQLTF
jgi:hypothetical protein